MKEGRDVNEAERGDADTKEERLDLIAGTKTNGEPGAKVAQPQTDDAPINKNVMATYAEIDKRGDHRPSRCCAQMTRMFHVHQLINMNAHTIQMSADHHDSGKKMTKTMLQRSTTSEILGWLPAPRTMGSAYST